MSPVAAVEIHAEIPLARAFGLASHERFDRASRYFRSKLDTERDMEIEPDPFAAT